MRHVSDIIRIDDYNVIINRFKKNWLKPVVRTTQAWQCFLVQQNWLELVLTNKKWVKPVLRTAQGC